MSFEGVGGAGTDRLNVFLGGPDTGPEPRILDGDVAVSLDGGAGGDAIGVIVSNGRLAREAELRLDVAGGAGPDREDIAFRGLTVDGTLTASVSGQDGADVIGLEVVWQVNAGASTEVNVLSGLGADEVAALTLNHIAAGARSVLTIDGGAGDDLLGFRYDGALVDGEFRFRVDAGDGDDLVRGDLRPDRASRGRIVAEVFGGTGDDELGLSHVGVSDPEDFVGVVDGGTGFDVARVTEGVRVRDCEEVFVVE